MQEAWGEGDGDGDPEHGAPAAAGESQALQQNPPRLPAAPGGHLQRQRRRQIAPAIRATLMLRASGDRSWRSCLLFFFPSLFLNAEAMQIALVYQCKV